MNRRSQKGKEKGEYELTFTPKRAAGKVVAGTTAGSPVAPTLPWDSLECPGEPSLPSAIGGSGYHGAKEYVAVLILPVMISLFHPFCEFRYSFFMLLFFFFNKCC